MAKQMQMTWGDRIRHEGFLKGKRETVLLVVRSRFTTVPEELRQQIEAIETPEALDALLQRALTASHLEDLRAALSH